VSDKKDGYHKVILFSTCALNLFYTGLRSEVFTALKIHSVDFWTMTLCNLVGGVVYLKFIEYASGNYDYIVTRLSDC
jgi:hypothetical protein